MDRLELLHAFARRKRWEAEVQAHAIINSLAKSLGGGPKRHADQMRPGEMVNGHRVIDPDAMLAQIGVL